MTQRRWSRQRDALRKRRLAFDHYTCQACGHCDPTGKSLHLDERVPLTLGGTETWDNTGTLCWRCNGIKGMSTLSYAEVGELRLRLDGGCACQRGGRCGATFFSPRLSVDQAQPKKYPQRPRKTLVSRPRATVWR